MPPLQQAHQQAPACDSGGVSTAERSTDACARLPDDRPPSRSRGLLQIGDVAERSRLSLRTVRYYEEVGLVQPADRSPGGFRLYTDAAVERLRVIKKMKPLEFTLEQMRELLDTIDQLAAGPTGEQRRELLATVEQYQQLVGERLDVLRQRLLDARTLASSLDDLLLD